MPDPTLHSSAVVAIGEFQLFAALCTHLGLTAEQYDGLFIVAAGLADQHNAGQAADVRAWMKAVNPRVGPLI